MTIKFGDMVSDMSILSVCRSVAHVCRSAHICLSHVWSLTSVFSRQEFHTKTQLFDFGEKLKFLHFLQSSRASAPQLVPCPIVCLPVAPNHLAVSLLSPVVCLSPQLLIRLPAGPSYLSVCLSVAPGPQAFGCMMVFPPKPNLSVCLSLEALPTS